MRARKKKNCDARLERCADYIVEKIELPEGNEKPVYLEIGCGKGKFAVEVAEKEDCLFYAIEIMKDIMVMAIEKGAAKQLDNIKYIIEISHFNSSFSSIVRVTLSPSFNSPEIIIFDNGRRISLRRIPRIGLAPY